ncbi:protein translocase subunit SecD [Actinospica durhamensis]|uniref:Protein translocase subunit SecD n=1 Tax=Actinospica durhamensis TaxID=1508375 RepID=A0A941ELD7_9ACTN|nr:protein translocase subunit SecD [Actinospica durhamensis]MBR7832672.1 protein translocase subunit SecD [Actinospica durhamensis]
MAAKKARSKKYSGLLSTRARGASNQRPWRPLLALGVVLVALYATMFGVNATHPRLAIDLAGGTSAVFTAEMGTKGATPSSADMDQAVSIMQQRVNGYGVSEATVTKEGSNTIDVEIPGQFSQATVNSIGATAHLYFRPVLASAAGVPTPTTSASPSTSSTGSTATPSASAKASSSTSATATTTAKASSSSTASESATGQSESGTVKADAATASASADTTGTASPAASSSATATSSAAAASASASASASAQESQAVSAYEALNCSDKASLKNVGVVKAGDYLATCGLDGYKYLLGPSVIDGKHVDSAIATQTVGSTGIATGAWEVDLSFDATGKAEFATETTALYQEVQNSSGSGQFAVTLDGIVQSAPVVQEAITGGTATINGTVFTEQTAKQLATTLSYGSLPLNFQQSQVSIVSPTLGSSELDGGLIAGGIGLLLVFLYVILYYRGLSVAAISSLLVAAALTFALACLFGPLMGFTLSLPGVAGLIVAIGITADSFVVFFERLRDELREGRSVRSAVSHAWLRARRTVIASDTVTLIAAVVLYLLTVGSVQGFAFTLGLSTVIDLVVIFMFTVPMVTLFSRTNFFGNGHPWSGLDPESLGRSRQGQGSYRAGSGRNRMTIAERRRQAEAESADAQGTDDESNQHSVEA